MAADARSRLAVADANIRAARAGDLSTRERGQQMIEFIGSCRNVIAPEGHVAAMSTELLDGCRAAYEASIETGRKTWWELGTEKVTPVLFVVFLLAAVGAAYSYNMRMSVHYDSRVNVVALWAYQHASLPVDKRAQVLSELVGNITADDIGFREVKTPVDQIMEFAKIMRSKSS